MSKSFYAAENHYGSETDLGPLAILAGAAFGLFALWLVTVFSLSL